MNRSRRLRLITLTETLIVTDITKIESYNCFIIYTVKKKIMTNAQRIDKTCFYLAVCNMPLTTNEPDIAL